MITLFGKVIAFPVSAPAKPRPAPPPPVQPQGTFHPYYRPDQLLDQFVTYVSSQRFTHFEQDIDDSAPKPYTLIVVTILLDELPVLVLIEDELLCVDFIRASLRKNSQFTFMKSPKSGIIRTIAF